MKKESITEIVTRLAMPVADSLNLLLWSVDYVKEGADMYLRITVDKPDGVTLDDCEAMHNGMDPILDAEDPIQTSYHLEVCSPGIEREIKEDWQVDFCQGEKVEIRLFAPLNGTKTYTGTLLPLTEDGKYAIALYDGSTQTFEKSIVARINTKYDFDAEKKG